MDIVLALVAGFLFALGLVLQELAASAQPRESVGGGFILRLVHQPVWLLGLASQGFGFVAQAWALGIGRMVIVQPLLVSTIVFGVTFNVEQWGLLIVVFLLTMSALYGLGMAMASPGRPR